MKYKVLPNARIVMARDGSKELFIDTGCEVIPLNNRLTYTETAITTILDTMPMECTLRSDDELPAGYGLCEFLLDKPMRLTLLTTLRLMECRICVL